jgi:hypothetical protein
VVSGIEGLIVLGLAVPLAALGVLAHLESVGRHRAAIELALAFDEIEGDGRPGTATGHDRPTW